MSHYLDTSVIMPLFMSEAASAAMVRWVADDRRILIVADLVVTEFHAVMSRFLRMGMVAEAEAAAHRQLFERWRDTVAQSLENLPADIREAGALVMTPRPKLLSADAIHIATCRRLDLTLVTYDADLQSIAAREGVSSVSPA